MEGSPVSGTEDVFSFLPVVVVLILLLLVMKETGEEKPASPDRRIR